MSLDLPGIFASAKELTSAPEWAAADMHRLSFLVELESGGYVPEGLQLRGSALKDIPDRNIMFQLEIHRAGRNLIQLARFCWMPLQAHVNRKGPPGLKGKLIRDSHCHHFHLNFVEDENRMRSGNLSVADNLESQPSDFTTAVKMMGQLFNIHNADIIQPPDWQGVLV